VARGLSSQIRTGLVQKIWRFYWTAIACIYATPHALRNERRYSHVRQTRTDRGYTRIARATTLNFAQRDFVTAARAIGASHLRIMMRELLPNLVPPISAIVVLGMSRIIVIEGTLSFLGLSLPPPAPAWGNMIAAGVSELAFHPAISFVPAGVMFITILALNVIGDALRRASDPRDTAL